MTTPMPEQLGKFCTCDDCKPMECEGCRTNRERRERRAAIEASQVPAGLIDYLRSRAAAGELGYTTLSEWADQLTAIEAATEQGKRQPLTEADDKFLGELARSTLAEMKEAIATIRKLDNSGVEPLPEQWSGVIYMAIFKAFLHGARTHGITATPQGNLP